MFGYVDMLIAELRYGAVDNMLSEARANMYIYPEELRYNHSHDPSNGRFTSGGGSFSPDEGELSGSGRKMSIAGITKFYSGGLTKPNNGGTIKATKKQRQEFKNKIVGTKTQNGTVIKDVYDHAADRMIERNISPQTVVEMLTSDSITIFPGNVAGRHCVQRDGIRIVYSDAGDVVTAIVAYKE